MARPKKTGLDYFPFDVDFFNDEKIEAISGEFGIKGEIVAIKLLAAIYRNGYFIEWSEMLQMKMLKTLPSISKELLTEIVQRYNIPVEELTVDTEKVELTREQQLERFKNMYTVADYERDLRKGLLLDKPLPFYNLNLLKLISEDIVNE